MDLLILGASARAAAFSALRAGLRPTCADLFADLDLAAVCDARRVDRERYLEGLAAVADAAPLSPWIYTGSLENHPEFVDRIAATRPLWGNAGATLRAVRDPCALADALRRAGLPGPGVRSSPEALPRDGSWLVKPVASAGGQDVHHWMEGMGPPPRASVYQERIDGPSFSALFVGRRDNAEFVGVTSQRIGRPGAPFAYVGSIGPWPLGRDESERLATLGQVLATSFGLVGLFGVDFVMRGGVAWPVEVNPRYTASVEVLELALGRSLLDEHRRICDPGAVFKGAASARPGANSPSPTPPLQGGDQQHGPGGFPLPPLQRGGWGGFRSGSEALDVGDTSENRSSTPEHVHVGGMNKPRVVGKLIVFASSPCRFPKLDDLPSPGSDLFAVPRLGDVPRPGTEFEPCEPVLTLFAGGEDVETCRILLEARRARWERRLQTSPR